MPTMTSKADAGKDGPAVKVRLGARPDSEHALAGRQVTPTGPLEEAWPPPPLDHVAQPDAKPPLVPVISIPPAGD